MTLLTLALPFFLQFLMIVSVKNVVRTKTRFTCLSESLLLVRRFSEHGREELAKKISGERIMNPVRGPGDPRLPVNRLAFRLKDGTVCGADKRKEGAEWKYRLIYETAGVKY